MNGRARINRRGNIQLGQGNTANADMQQIASQFLATLAAKKQSPQTVDKRRDCLRKFLLFLEASGIERFADVDGKTLETFRLCLIEHDYSPNEIEANSRTVLYFFRHLEERNLIFDNPAERMHIQKPRVTMGTVLTEGQMQRLLSVPDITRPIGLRDRALLEVLYSTGMRREEALNLTVYAVDLDRATVKVEGKGRKQRLIPLGKQAVKYLRLYLLEARPWLVPRFAPPSDALWLNRRRNGMGESSIWKTVTTCAKTAGIKNADTHTLRRTCATHLLRGGAHAAVVAQILGHSGLRTLSHYLRTTIADLKKAHAHSNPGR